MSFGLIVLSTYHRLTHCITSILGRGHQPVTPIQVPNRPCIEPLSELHSPMCAKDTTPPSTSGADDDVWGDSSDSDGNEQARAGPSQLDREWEARKQQFYNAGFREGLEEGKEVTLQQGFNAGFAEGAQAGYEFGLVKSTLQVLAAHLAVEDSRRAKVQELLQQVSALDNRTVMVDTCKALLGQQPADVVAAHLQAALTLQGADGEPAEATAAAEETTAAASSSQAAPAAVSQPAAAAAAGEPASSSSSGMEGSSQAASLPLPLQLVAHLKQELLQLGFSIGSAPPLTVSSGSGPAEADEDEAST